MDRVDVLGERKEQVAPWRSDKEHIRLQATTALQRPKSRVNATGIATKQRLRLEVSNGGLRNWSCMIHVDM